MPKLSLVYYKSILDQCFMQFFRLHEDCFARAEDGKYVLARCPSRSKLQKIFMTLLKEQLKKYVQPYNVMNLDFCLVLGSCRPKDNLLLEFKDGYFPAKLSKFIGSKLQLKYLLKETDIDIDLALFNQVLDDIFDQLFSSRNAVLKLLGEDYKNVLFIKHKCLDCYALLKTVKFLYGRSNCTNIYEQKIHDKRSPLVAVNELIDKYVHSKHAMNKSKKFKAAVIEVKQFIDQKIEEANKQ